MHPTLPRERGREHESQVLQVALAPSPVTGGSTRQRDWTLLVAADQEIPREAHFIASAPHQRGLHEVMAQNGPAERRRREPLTGDHNAR